jgi:hypothetical protein
MTTCFICNSLNQAGRARYKRGAFTVCQSCRMPGDVFDGYGYDQPAEPKPAPFAPPKAKKYHGKNQYANGRKYVPKKDLSGLVVGDPNGEHLLVLSHLGGGWWKCQCRCGRFRTVATSPLTRGDVTSCHACGRARANEKRKRHTEARRMAEVA